MAAYREPGFQERTALAARAKRAALEKLRAKPPVNAAEQAARIARATAREAAAAEKREARRLASEEATAAKRADAAMAPALAQTPAPPSDADRKAARDARYAARKDRKPK